jgi:hypothetical protein
LNHHADTGSIENFGIELAAILAAAIAVVSGADLIRTTSEKRLIRTVRQWLAPVVRRCVIFVWRGLQPHHGFVLSFESTSENSPETGPSCWCDTEVCYMARIPSFLYRNQVALFRRLFRGRTDVYPIRWEGTGRWGIASRRSANLAK